MNNIKANANDLVGQPCGCPRPNGRGTSEWQLL